MKSRTLAAHAGILAIVLAVTYAEATREATPEGHEEVTVWDLRKSDVRGVRWEDGADWARVERKRDARTGDEHVWVTTPRGGFRGNETAEKLLDKFAPLRAVRDLGKIAKKRLARLELDVAKKRVVVVTPGGERRLRLGGTTYGAGDAYARDPRTRHVFLLSNQLLGDLRFASSRLMERRVHRFAAGDVDRAVVRAGDRSRTLLQRYRADAARARWVDAAAPERRDELLKNWLTKVMRLTASEYVRDESAITHAKGQTVAPEPIVSVEYFDGARSVGRVEIRKVEREAGAADYYARSETTVAFVKLARSLAEEIARDAAKVAGAE